MMFHNVEVLPLLSPYTRSQKDCRKLMDRLERFVIFCKEQGAVGINLSALHEIIKHE